MAFILRVAKGDFKLLQYKLRTMEEKTNFERGKDQKKDYIEMNKG